MKIIFWPYTKYYFPPKSFACNCFQLWLDQFAIRDSYFGFSDLKITSNLTMDDRKWDLWKHWSVENEVIVLNEYLAAENEILKSKFNEKIKFKDYERFRFVKIGKHRHLIFLIRFSSLDTWFERIFCYYFRPNQSLKKVFIVNGIIYQQ